MPGRTESKVFENCGGEVGLLSGALVSEYQRGLPKRRPFRLFWLEVIRFGCLLLRAYVASVARGEDHLHRKGIALPQSGL